jgi:hypothetical protein
MKMLKTGSGAITAYHNIEDGTGVSGGGSLFNGKTLTLSYYAKASAAIDNSGQVWLYYNNGSSSVQVATCTDSLTTSWAKYTHTFTMPTNTETHTNVNKLTLSLIRALDADVSDSDWIEVAQVQLEEGSVATDFEYRSYGEELALCQRYYQKHYVGIRGAKGNGTAMIGFSMDLPVAMRAAATVTIGAGSTCSVMLNDSTLGGFNINSITISKWDGSMTYVNFNISGSALTDNRGYLLQSVAYLECDSEL